MNYAITDRRLMVSFGEPCIYGCAYCYASMAPFEHYPRRTVSEIVNAISAYPQLSFDNIYVGCDMEPFVDESRALELLSALMVFHKTIHVTTKVCLSDDTISAMAGLDTLARSWGAMLIPGVSICATSNSSRLEPPPIPSYKSRLYLIQRLSTKGLRVVLAMRPFIPSVSLAEYDEILDNVTGQVDCVLGGVLYADLGGVVESRLGYQLPDTHVQKMHFVDSSAMWKVYPGERERYHVGQRCLKTGLDFYMTSPPAIEAIKHRCVGG
jgi:DNA repair photolyase